MCENDFDVALACEFLERYCIRYGRLGGQVKEKYGTIRFYARFGAFSLHGLMKPGYNYYTYPRWLLHLDSEYFEPLINKLFGRMLYKWQEYIYGRAYTLALKKWPHLRKALLCGADDPELIPGATRIEGNNKHVLDWDGSIMATWTRAGG